MKKSVIPKVLPHTAAKTRNTLCKYNLNEGIFFQKISKNFLPSSSLETDIQYITHCAIIVRGTQTVDD